MTSNHVHLLVKDTGGDVMAQSMRLIAGRRAQEEGDLLQKRIRRVLAIAQAFDYSTLVLGAWGCGAFGNDPSRTVVDFRGAFSEILFAISDWSAERRFSDRSETFSLDAARARWAQPRMNVN